MMLTALKGDTRLNTAQPLRLPAFPLPDAGFSFPESDLDYIATVNGVLVTCNGLLVAWIYKGQAGSRTNPNKCHFYDVACPSITFDHQSRITGVMLDSLSFDTLPEAVQHIETTFAGMGVHHG